MAKYHKAALIAELEALKSKRLAAYQVKLDMLDEQIEAWRETASDAALTFIHDFNVKSGNSFSNKFTQYVPNPPSVPLSPDLSRYDLRITELKLREGDIVNLTEKERERYIITT